MEQNNFSKYEDIKSRLVFGDLTRDIPKISFVIPTYKRPVLVQRAVNSILAQKTSREYDIVVVDNENTEDSDTERYFRELCSKHQNVYYYKNEKNIMGYPNWNRCYELARSQWCCILLSDDELKENYLERVVDTVKKYRLDCVRVGSDILDKENKKIPERNILDKRYLNRPKHVEFINSRYFLFRGALPPSGMFVRRDIMIKLGGYDYEYEPVADCEFDSRLVKKYKVGLLWERLCITHLEDSTSMKGDIIRLGIVKDNRLLKKIYHENYKDRRIYPMISDIRTFITIDKCGYKVTDFLDIGANVRYNNKFLKLSYKLLYRLHRIKQTIER